MNSKILVFRSANMRVFVPLMEKLSKEEDVTCLVQENMVEELQEKYPNVKIVSLKENYFNYESFCKNVNLEDSYDTIYIPSTSIQFSGFEEIFEIVDHIKHKKLILHDCEGKEKVEVNNMFVKIKQAIFDMFVMIYMRLCILSYRMFGKNRGI